MKKTTENADKVSAAVVFKFTCYNASLQEHIPADPIK